MPGTYTPRQMFDHELNPSKGWPSQYAVDKSLPMYIEHDSAPTYYFGGNTNFHYMDDFKAGMVAHIEKDTDNQYKIRLGLAQDAMPMFLFPNGSDTDVTGDKGNIIGTGKASLATAAMSGTVAGHIVALVAKGAYELETTEFVGTTFEPNTPLTAVGAPAKARTVDENDNPGKLKAYTWAEWRAGDISDVENLGCVGTVADGGMFKNEHGKYMIRFWPEHLPSPATQA